MDPNQNQDQKDQNLILSPEDSIMKSQETFKTVVSDPDPSPVTQEVSYTPPQAWGQDETFSPQGIAATPPPIQENPPTEKSSYPLIKTLFSGIALILFGTLLGVLASHFLPISPGLSSITPEISPSPTPSLTETMGIPGSCTATYEVEINTEELTAKQNYSMYCSDKQSEQGCLSVDVYNQKLDDFSAPDGFPDCKWNVILATPPSVEGKSCGGIAANLPENQCPDGFYCKLDGKYPDAGGVCSKR